MDQVWSFCLIADNATCRTYNGLCGAGYHYDSGAAEVECNAANCDVSDRDTCCNVNQLCSAYTCPVGYHSGSGASNAKCQEQFCNDGNDRDACCNSCAHQTIANGNKPCFIGGNEQSDENQVCVGSNNAYYRCTAADANAGYRVKNHLVKDIHCVRPSGLVKYNFGGSVSENLVAPSFSAAGVRCSLGYSWGASCSGKVVLQHG